MGLADHFSLLRTLDPSHKPSTSNSTNWALEGILDKSPVSTKETRLHISRTRCSQAIDQRMRETLYKVLADAFFIGDSCIKPVSDNYNTRGICDLCYALREVSTAESLKHVILDCPFSQPIIVNFHKAIIRLLHPDVAHISLTLCPPQPLSRPSSAELSPAVP